MPTLGVCWDCGKQFRKHQRIRINEIGHLFHIKCSKSAKWHYDNFIWACPIPAIWIYMRTPLLYKKSDKLGFKLKDPIEFIGDITELLGVQQ